MASVLPRRGGSQIVMFSTRGGLGVNMPPSPPGAPLRYGSYCFRATCLVEDDAHPGCPVAKVKGYDRTPEIGKDTEEVCRAHARTMGGQFRCGEAEVVLLPHSSVECSGQVVFVMDGSVRRLV
jgi:hypothetical protein